MTLPRRFLVEYPERCSKLLQEFEGTARESGLHVSFSLMVAQALIVVPVERLRKTHPMRDEERETEVARALALLYRRRFCEADFWIHRRDQRRFGASWRLTRVKSATYSEADLMVDEDGKHPLADDAKNYATSKKTGDVFRILRNALAHGNILYLSKKGRSVGEKYDDDNVIRYIIFLSRYEETNEHRQANETYRWLSVDVDEFLVFLRCWAKWLCQFIDPDKPAQDIGLV